MSLEPTPESQTPAASRGNLDLVAKTLGGLVGGLFSSIQAVVIAAPIVSHQSINYNSSPETERKLRESQQQNAELLNIIKEKDKTVHCLQMSIFFIVLAFAIVAGLYLCFPNLRGTGHCP